MYNFFNKKVGVIKRGEQYTRLLKTFDAIAVLSTVPTLSNIRCVVRESWSLLPMSEINYHAMLLPETMVTGQFANKPTHGQSSHRLVNSQTMSTCQNVLCKI